MKLIGCLIVLLLAGTACTDIACGCTPGLNQAIVWGQVTIDSGGPASRAAMFAEATPTGASCVQNTLTAWGRALFPPTQAGRDTVLGPFKMKFGANPPFDSMNVDLVIPH